MTSGAAGLPQPLTGVTYLCWYLDSFSSSQAVLPPPKPSCSVRSRPWVQGGVAVRAWDPPSNPFTRRVPRDTLLPGTCHPLPSPEPSHCAPGNAVGVPPLHPSPAQATPLLGPVTTLIPPACDASGAPNHITPPRTPFVTPGPVTSSLAPHVCHPWTPPATVSGPPAPSRAAAVSPHTPRCHSPPVCPRAAASVIPVSPRPAP